MWLRLTPTKLRATLVGVFASQTSLASASPAAPTVRDEQQMTHLGSQLLQDADHADQALQKNDDAAADKDINDALAAAKDASQPLTVKSNVGQVTYMAIDLDASNRRLNAAKTAIRNKNDQAAEDSLAAIGSNLVAVSVTTDLPLLTAREDLALARTALNAKNDQAAGADLRQASQALTAYAASGPHASDAKKLAGEIDSDAGTTAAPASTSTQAVDAWWSRVKDWFAHPSV